MIAYLLLAAAIVLEVTATLSLRASDGLRRRIWLIPVLGCYIAALVLLVLILAIGLPVGLTYGIWAASGVALTAIGGKILFGERLTPRMTAGIALIAVGVFVISASGAGHV